MKGFEKIISEAEEKWLDLLSRHCRELFENTFLPSHDHFHHGRVWNYARSLLILLEEAGASIPEILPEQLLIAVYFHDTGLTVTQGEQHGLESRKLCETFFRTTMNIGPPDESMEMILHSIEYHDDKSLKTAALELSQIHEPNLLSILSASDDLDAFGKMGTYRYAEIYLLRGIAPEQLPLRVSENVMQRFENIRTSYGKLESFIRFHESRYLEVRDFYLRLGQAYASLGEKASWEPTLIEIFRTSLQERKNLLKPHRLLPESDFDAEIRNWFSSLDGEIKASDQSG